MSERHYIVCDAVTGPGSGCSYRADHRFELTLECGKEHIADACSGHAEHYRGDPHWREVPLPEINCEATRRELAEARATNQRLNRRCQLAESGLAEQIEEAKRSGGSLGRALANAAASMYERERDQLRVELDGLVELVGRHLELYHSGRRVQAMVDERIKEEFAERRAERDRLRLVLALMHTGPQDIDAPYSPLVYLVPVGEDGMKAKWLNENVPRMIESLAGSGDTAADDIGAGADSTTSGTSRAPGLPEGSSPAPPTSEADR